MTAVAIITVGSLLGLGLVASQLVRLKEWLNNAPIPETPPDASPGDFPDDDDA